MRDAREIWLQLTAVDIKLIEQFDYLSRVGGSIYPSQRWLAEKLRVSERTIRRGVAHLKSLGVILVQPRRYRNQHGHIRSHTNAYKILGLAGAFLRGLLSRITGRPKPPGAPTRRKKVERSDSFLLEKKELRPEILARMPILQLWLGRS